MKNKKPTKLHILLLIATILLAAICLLFIRWMFSPKKGSVTLHSSSSTGSPAAQGNKVLAGTHITFNYNSGYVLKSEGNKNNELEIHTLSAGTNYTKQIIASVSHLPDEQITSNGAYIYRKLHADLYTLRTLDLNGVRMEVWVKKDGTEQTAMIPRGNKIATIAFVTKSPNNDLTPEVNALLSTFRWK